MEYYGCLVFKILYFYDICYIDVQRQNFHIQMTIVTNLKKKFSITLDEIYLYFYTHIFYFSLLQVGAEGKIGS